MNMGLLSSIIAKGVATAARNSTIKVVGNTTSNVIETIAKNAIEKDDIAVKNGITLIKPTRSSEEYYGESALEIAKELHGAGFESITLKPVKELRERAVKKYGNIKSISINGKTEFLGKKKVPASSYIVIKYLDFREDVDLRAYMNVERIRPGIMNRNEQQGNFPESNAIPTGHTKKFCPYCGAALSKASTNFCSNCGNAIDR